MAISTAITFWPTVFAFATACEFRRENTNKKCFFSPLFDRLVKHFIRSIEITICSGSRNHKLWQLHMWLWLNLSYKLAKRKTVIKLKEIYLCGFWINITRTPLDENLMLAWLHFWTLYWWHVCLVAAKVKTVKALARMTIIVIIVMREKKVDNGSFELWWWWWWGSAWGEIDRTWVGLFGSWLI